MTSNAIFWVIGVLAGIFAHYMAAPWELVLATTGAGMICISAMGE